VTVNRFRLIGVVILSALSINSVHALPIDWTGVFGVDTALVSNFRRTTDTVTQVEKPLPSDSTGTKTRNGTEAIRSGDNGASYQTYIFKLNPQIIVNDGVTLKGELSSGYLRGGFAGGDSTGTANGSANNSYFYTTPAQRSALNLNQMYMELYADTALVKIGRMSKNYGLGMIWSGGNQAWDRFFTMYDGIEAQMTIGNFSLTPYYSKISSYNNGLSGPNNQGTPGGSYDVREMGLTAQYDNKNRDLVVSVLYAKRSSERRASLYSTNTTTADNQERGSTSVTVIEPYISKKWNKFKVSAEGSLQSGKYGNIYGAGQGDSKLASTVYMVDAKYELNPKWEMGVLAGQVSGDKGSTSKFEAAYLHPNFQIAELMFRYYYPGFAEGGRSIFDSSITNTQFYKMKANYKTDKWTWKSAFIMAKALQTAKSGQRAYHHEENYSFQSTQKQSNNMGYELDVGFDYRWNPNVTISGNYGYWFVGDYYAFTNQAKKLGITNIHGGSLRATLEF
jgi:hypothetical protein